MFSCFYGYAFLFSGVWCKHSTMFLGKRANMKTVAIISQKGGTGKTTLAVHLGVAAEKRGLRTAIFDLDPQASAASWHDRRDDTEPVVFPAQAPRLKNLMEQAREQKADLVLIDSAPNADSASITAARMADMILIPCRPAAFDLNAIGTTLGLASLASRPAWVVLNAVPPQGRLAEEARAALKSEGVKVADPLIHHLIAFAHSVNDGLTAQEYDPKCKAAAEIESFFDWLVQQLNIKAGLRANAQTLKHS
jgi:chromosome partitioning protein